MPVKEISNINTLDSARYHACGNAVSVPVVEWIGQRIVDQLADAIIDERYAANSMAKSA
jgi:DNA (cytosine-5)-methyltransferase 1